MARVGIKQKKALRRTLKMRPLTIGGISIGGRYLAGSMLIVHPATAIIDQWQKNYDLCVQYRDRFGVKVALPFWYLNSMSEAVTVLQEALDQDRRRWVLECGGWAGDPRIETFREIIEMGGRSLDSISLDDAKYIWLDPPEWIEPECTRLPEPNESPRDIEKCFFADPSLERIEDLRVRSSKNAVNWIRDLDTGVRIYWAAGSIGHKQAARDHKVRRYESGVEGNL